MRARGFSLIELMIALTLAMIVTGGVISVFIGSRSAFQATSGTAQLTESGRFALSFIANSVRSAGYMSCTTASHVQGILNAGATPLPYSFNQSLGGYEAKNTGATSAYTLALSPVTVDTTNSDWLTSPAGGLDAALAALPIKNNDVLVVRSTLRNAQSVYVSSIVDGAAQFTVNTQGPLANGQVAIIADCSKGSLFQISSVTVGANAVVRHNAGGVPGNASAAFPISFSAGSQVTPVDTLVYYIGKGADGDGALFSYDMNGGVFTASELVSDIEAMQILYGIDGNSTQIVSSYVTADQVIDFNTVMSVKIAVLAASAPGAAHAGGLPITYSLLGTQVTVPLDTRVRQVFEATVAVRNSLP
jgi:type IV pilus assembly protein PilW